MAKFRDVKTLQKFAAVHASIHNHFDQEVGDAGLPWQIFLIKS